ncbi:MAG TPA: hypothetical protein VMV20_05545 [Chitinophagaceae bacterium]|nr:hypothetical protein [Chitinophagaceae bacterium]
MDNNFRTFFDHTGELLKDYLEARTDLVRLHIAGKISRALGLFFTLILASLLVFFIIIFLGMVVGFWMGTVTGSNAIGFLISTGIFAVLLTVVVVFRRPLVQTPVVNIILAVLLEGNDEGEEEEQNQQNNQQG